MCGSIRICTTPERLDEAKYQMQRHGWMKSPQRIITTEEVTKLHPLLNVDDVLGALYFPGKESLISIDALFLFHWLHGYVGRAFRCCGAFDLETTHEGLFRVSRSFLFGLSLLPSLPFTWLGAIVNVYCGIITGGPDSEDHLS